jgi:hypothetical protein
MVDDSELNSFFPEDSLDDRVDTDAAVSHLSRALHISLDNRPCGIAPSVDVKVIAGITGDDIACVWQCGCDNAFCTLLQLELWLGNLVPLSPPKLVPVAEVSGSSA